MHTRTDFDPLDVYRRGGARALVIVPTYNERETIVPLVDRFFEVAHGHTELLVVDDSSPDGTADVVRSLAAGNSAVHLLERPGKQGLASAYIAGFRWGLARGFDAVVEMDGDLSHDPRAVPQLLAGLSDADVVIGSRYVAGGRVEDWSFLRRRLSEAANVYARALLHLSVRDSTSGFRAYRASWIAAQDLDSITTEGYAFQIELTLRAQRSGARIVEVPITFADRAQGKSKLSRRIILEALLQVARWAVKDRSYVSRATSSHERVAGATSSTVSLSELDSSEVHLGPPEAR
jgi:dolichol-phosphate mannosyltransferase